MINKNKTKILTYLMGKKIKTDPEFVTRLESPTPTLICSTEMRWWTPTHAVHVVRKSWKNISEAKIIL